MKTKVVWQSPIYQLEIYLDGLLVYETDEITRIDIFGDKQIFHFKSWMPAVAGIVKIKVKNMVHGGYFEDYEENLYAGVRLYAAVVLHVDFYESKS